MRRMAPPLPAASAPSKAHTSERLLEARVAHQLGEACLPLGQFGPVRLVSQLELEIELGEDVAAVVSTRTMRRQGRRRPVGAGQLLPHGVQQDLAHRQRAIAVIGAFDHDPRRPRGVGHAQQVAGHLLQPVVGLEPVPVPLGDAPRGLRVASPAP